MGSRAFGIDVHSKYRFPYNLIFGRQYAQQSSNMYTMLFRNQLHLKLPSIPPTLQHFLIYTVPNKLRGYAIILGHHSILMAVSVQRASHLNPNRISIISRMSEVQNSLKSLTRSQVRYHAGICNHHYTYQTI